MTQFHLIIPAAGNGNRMASNTPKQYLDLLGEPVISHALMPFLNCSRIHGIHVVLSHEDAIFNTLSCAQRPKLNLHYCGGETRANTVLNAMHAIQNKVQTDDWILVHDAARPCLSENLLNNLLNTLQSDDVGGLLAIPLAETLKRADANGKVANTEPRENLWQAQTPQMFRYGMLKQALTMFSGTPTDEAQAIEVLGYAPTLVLGSLSNLKITYPQDLALARAVLNANREEKQTSCV